MPFTNPIVAGTTLVRSAIRSPDYVTGVSGWAINRDGTAEFNELTARGTLLVQGDDGSKIVAYADPTLGAIVVLYPPGVTDLVDTVLLQAYGNPASLTIATADRLKVTQRESGISGPYPGGHLQVDGNLYMGTRDQGRGLVETVTPSMANSAVTGVGTSFTSVMSANALLQPNRVYEIRWRGGMKSSADGILGYYRVSVGPTVAGEGLRFRGVGVPVINVEWTAKFRFTRVVAGILTINVEAFASTGTIDDFGNATTPRGFLLYDVGDATDTEYSNFVAIT